MILIAYHRSPRAELRHTNKHKNNTIYKQQKVIRGKQKRNPITTPKVGATQEPPKGKLGGIKQANVVGNGALSESVSART